MKIITTCLITLLPYFGITQSISATYNTGDIPTSYNAFDGSCTGPSTALSLTLPPGDNYEVTGIDISYDMAALNSGWMSHQRSSVHCQTTGNGESTFSGVGDMNGIYVYDRTNADIANGTYIGGTELIFEMRAWRTVEGTPGCNLSDNRVNALTWTITVYYGDEIVNPKVGIETTNPSTTFDVEGKIKIGDDSNMPVAGMIRWNDETQDFEGYNGSTWMSFTKTESTWGDTRVHENMQLFQSAGAGQNGFGYGPSIHEEFLFVGTPLFDMMANENQGVVFVYERLGNEITLLDTLISSDGDEQDAFGRSVSSSGNYLLTGAQYKTVGGNISQGQAYIFTWNGNEWVEQDILIASDGDVQDIFGRVLDISGDYAIIGAFQADVGGSIDEGKAYIFHRNGAIWEEQEIFIASDGATEDYFGHAVAISGYYAIVGAPQHDTGGNTWQGKAYIFKRSGNEWQQVQMLTDINGSENDGFGYDVEIDGDYAIIGAIQNGEEGNEPGAAFIYRRNGTLWELQAELQASDIANGDFFGYSVAIHGDHALVSAPGKDINGHDIGGKVYLFQRDGTNWKEIASFTASIPSGDDSFGLEVDIYDNISAVAAPFSEVNGTEDQGKVYLFKK